MTTLHDQTEQQHRARLRGELEAQHAIAATETRDEYPHNIVYPDCHIDGCDFVAHLAREIEIRSAREQLDDALDDPTHTDDAPETLCLLLGHSFFGQCRHARCRAIGAAVAAAETEALR